jgi:hypothetical protein
MILKPESIKQIVELALGDNKSSSGEFIMSKLPIKQAKIIEAYIDKNIVGGKRLIETSAIRHTMKRHGIERRVNQIAVIIEDFQKIPLILKEPDKIVYGGKNKLQQHIFLYHKRIGCNYIIAEAIRSINKKTLVFCSLYKQK